MAALAALAGTAAAQEQSPAPASTTEAPAAEQAPAATETTPTVTTPETTVPGPDANTPTDLGTLQVQVDKLPPAAKKKPVATVKTKDDTAAVPETSTDPFGQLPSPLLAPPTIGVPNVLLDEFRIPPFLLPLYQAAGVEYGVRWEVLAAINEVETDYGRNLSISTAGAVGWMQFMPSTWERYGVDANGDGDKDPYNPVDAIFAAARYLHAAGAGANLQAAIYAYNHAGWYVDEVIARARAIAALPTELVGALTGLTMGRSPVTGTAAYADSTTYGTKRSEQETNASVAIAGTATRKGANVYATAGAAAVAVQDGKVVRIGSSRRLGRFVRLRDAYGNTYTYGHLGSVADLHAVPLRDNDGQLKQHAAAAAAARDVAASSAAPAAAATTASAPVKERLFAEPARPNAYHAGGERQLAGTTQAAPAPQAVASDELGLYLAPPHGLRRDQVTLRALRQGSRVIAGTILGHLGTSSATGSAVAAASKLKVAQTSRLRFEIRPAGSGAPRIDPTPILDGWKLLDTTEVYRSSSPMLGADGSATIGQILLMSKELLERRVLADPAIQIYPCGRQDIAAGVVDRRVLATLEFLAASGLKPSVTALRCGHSYYTTSGNVSEHSSGAAVDIASINGTPIFGHQGEGSITDITVRRLLTLQGAMKAHQIITLMQYAGTDNTYAMGDHDDHIHVGFQPRYGANAAAGKQLSAVIKPGQWSRLIGRLSSIQNPTVPVKPSRYAIKVKLKTRG